MHILITRPKEDAVFLANRLNNRDIKCIVEPLIEIVYLDKPMPNLSSVYAILITSANGIRALARLSSDRTIAIWTVGDASASTALSLGYRNVKSASGDVNDFARLVIQNMGGSKRPLLHISGSQVAGDLGKHLKSAGLLYKRCILYEAQARLKLSENTSRMIRKGLMDGVMLYSPRTAEIFLKLIINLGLGKKLRGLSVFCLSEAVEKKIKMMQWKKIAVAQFPNEASLIREILDSKATLMKTISKY